MQSTLEGGNMPKHWKDKIIEDDPTLFSEPDDYVGPGIFVSLAVVCMALAIVTYLVSRAFL